MKKDNKNIVHQLSKVRIIIGKNMILIFHQNLLHFGGKAIFHWLPTPHSPSFFLAFKKILKGKLLKHTAKPDKRIFPEKTSDENCCACKSRGGNLFLNVQVLHLQFFNNTKGNVVGKIAENILSFSWVVLKVTDILNSNTPNKNIFSTLILRLNILKF